MTQRYMLDTNVVLALVVVHEMQHGRRQTQDDREEDEQYQPLDPRHGKPRRLFGCGSIARC